MSSTRQTHSEQLKRETMSYCEGLESTGRQLLLLVSDPRRLACPFMFLGSLICKHKVSLEMEAGLAKGLSKGKYCL